MAVAVGRREQPDQSSYAGKRMLDTYAAAPSRRQKVGDPAIKIERARLTGIYGNTGTAKSSIIASAGFLNLEYKALLERFKCPKTVKVLQKGIVPEVTKIAITDTDGGKWLIDMEQGDWSSKFAPLKAKGVFEVTPFQIRRTEERKTGKEMALDDPGIEEEKREIESSIINDLRDSSIDLVAVDSMSDYIKVLDDKLDLLYWENPKAFNEGEVEGLKAIKQILYGKRAKWYFTTLSAMRNAKKNMILTFQISEVPTNYQKKRTADKDFDPVYEDPSYNVRWVPGTGFKLDNVYYTMKDYTSNVFKVNWRKGPWQCDTPLMTMPNDPFMYPHMIEAHADGLLGEFNKEAFAKGEKFW
jgi:hypothetical protein